jgi:hypothetical protein
VILESALEVGRWRYLSDAEVNELQLTLGLKSVKPRGSKGSAGKKPREKTADSRTRTKTSDSGPRSGKPPKRTAYAKSDGSSPRGRTQKARTGGKSSPAGSSTGAESPWKGRGGSTGKPKRR